MRFTSFQLNIGSHIFKALSEEARLRIMYLLYTNGQMCVSDIEQILDYTQSKTSRHVSFLRNSGLLSIYKKEKWVFYSIKEEYVGIIAQILSFMEKDTTINKDQEIYKTLYANNVLAIRKLHNLQSTYKLPEL